MKKPESKNMRSAVVATAALGLATAAKVFAVCFNIYTMPTGSYPCVGNGSACLTSDGYTITSSYEYCAGGNIWNGDCETTPTNVGTEFACNWYPSFSECIDTNHNPHMVDAVVGSYDYCS